MRVRVRFSKFGSSRFIGHLDIMRYFQKAFKRAGLPLAYSEGYHPHPILSFAQPLSLSFTSDGEYFDMELCKDMESDEIMKALSEVMCDTILVNRVTILPDFQLNEKKTTGMSLITGAYYAISVRNMSAELTEAVRNFALLNEYIIEKTTKKGTKEVNLRAGVHDLLFYHKGCLDEIIRTDDFAYSDNEIRASLSNAILYDDKAIIVSLDAGSECNISADLFMNGIGRFAGLNSDEWKRTVHRIDLFGDQNGRKVPLWNIKS